ncbi:MAG: hypothetical protein EZS28_038168, partial [Streblomastix strix]
MRRRLEITMMKKVVE